MNIFHVANIDLSVEGATTRHVFEVCENLIKLGHKVTLFVPNRGKYRYETPVQIIKIPIPKVPFSLPFLFQIGLFFYLMSFSLRSKPDIIYTRSTIIGIAQKLIKTVISVPLVTEINANKPEEARMNGASEWKIWFIKFFERRFYGASDRLIAVTVGLKEWLINDYQVSPEKIAVIPNGANTDISRPMDQQACQSKLGFSEDALYVCFVGTLLVWQGVEYLIEAAPLILEDIPEAKFIIVGDGVTKHSLLEMVNKKNLQDYFVFTEQVPYQQVPLYINACDVCIAPFVREKRDSAPLKVFEYLACGKPVVTSSNIEAIEHFQTGIIIEPENSLELADSLVYLLRNKSLRTRMGKNGRELAVREFSWEAVTKKVEAVCLETIDKRVTILPESKC